MLVLRLCREKPTVSAIKRRRLRVTDLPKETALEEALLAVVALSNRIQSHCSVMIPAGSILWSGLKPGPGMKPES